MTALPTPYLSPNQFGPYDLELSALRQHVDDFDHWLEEAFNQGKDVVDLVHIRSDYLDALLTRLWQSFKFEKQSGMSLIAVGGYTVMSCTHFLILIS